MYLLHGSSKVCKHLASHQRSQSTSLARAMLCGQKYVVGCEIFDMESNGVRKTDLRKAGSDGNGSSVLKHCWDVVDVVVVGLEALVVLNFPFVRRLKNASTMMHSRSVSGSLVSLFHIVLHVFYNIYRRPNQLFPLDFTPWYRHASGTIVTLMWCLGSTKDGPRRFTNRRIWELRKQILWQFYSTSSFYFMLGLTFASTNGLLYGPMSLQLEVRDHLQPLGSPGE